MTDDEPGPGGETFGEAFERIRRDIEALPAPARWVLRRRLAYVRRRIDRRRDAALRRWWNDPR